MNLDQEEEVDFGAISAAEDDDVISLGDASFVPEETAQSSQNKLDGSNALGQSRTSSAGASLAARIGDRPTNNPQQSTSSSSVQQNSISPSVAPSANLPPRPQVLAPPIRPYAEDSRQDSYSAREQRDHHPSSSRRDAIRSGEASSGSKQAERSEAPLPAGWISKISSKGQQYFYAPALDKSVWERPTTAAPPIEAANKAPVPAAHRSQSGRDISTAVSRQSPSHPDSAYANRPTEQTNRPRAREQEVSVPLRSGRRSPSPIRDRFADRSPVHRHVSASRPIDQRDRRPPVEQTFPRGRSRGE